MPWGNMIVVGYITGLMNITFQNFSNSLYHPQIEQLIVYSDICGSIVQIVNFALLPMPFKQYLYSALQYLSFRQICSRKWAPKGIVHCEFPFQRILLIPGCLTYYALLTLGTDPHLPNDIILQGMILPFMRNISQHVNFAASQVVWIWWQQYLPGEEAMSLLVILELLKNIKLWQACLFWCWFYKWQD